MDKSQIVSNLVLFTLAFFIKLIIFIVDLNVPVGLALGSLYCIVILYSWLLPGKSSSLLMAVICSILVVIGFVLSDNPDPDSHTPIINRIISVMVIWVTAFLVAIAKRSFDSLEDTKDGLEAKVKLRTKELNEFNIQLINKNKELEQFAYIASHDLQEPLQTVLNFTERLDLEYKDELEGRGTRYIEFISSSSNRMRNIIKDLLDYSRIGRSPKLEQVDCNDLLKEVLSDMNQTISESKSQIKINPLPVIQAYPGELRLLFQNLLSNAIKFQAKDQVPVVEIACETMRNSWRFSVKDNGIGIRSEFKEKIFIIFQQLNKRGSYSGTGIGLAHCQKIVDMHKGMIWVKSNDTEGSTFFFTIPNKL